MSLAVSTPATAAAIAADAKSTYLDAMIGLCAVGVNLAYMTIPVVDQPRPEVAAFLNSLATLKQSAQIAVTQTLPAIVAGQTSLLTTASGLAANFQTVNDLATKFQGDPSDGVTKAALIALLGKMAVTTTVTANQIIPVIKPLEFIFDGLATPYGSVLPLANNVMTEIQTDTALIKQYEAAILQLETQVGQVLADFKAHLEAMDLAMTVGVAIGSTLFGAAVVASGVVAAVKHYVELDDDKLIALQSSIATLEASINAVDAQMLPLLAAGRYASKLQMFAGILQTDISVVMSTWAEIANALNELASQLHDNDMSELTNGNPVNFSLYLQETSAVWANLEAMVSVVQAKVGTTTAKIVIGMSSQHVAAAVKAAIHTG